MGDLSCLINELYTIIFDMNGITGIL